MGSHSSQCFASHQTIAPGDKCYALAIRQQSTYETVHMTFKGEAHQALGISHGAIYPNAYWTPVGNFIEGVYCGNGDIDITETDENVRRLLVFVRLMLENAPVVAQGENETHHLPFDLPQYLANNTPFLKAYLDNPPAAALTAAESHELFKGLARVWRHVDDVAFKHRVFYADSQHRMRPLQLTLMHKRCFDHLLGQVSEKYSPQAIFDRGLAGVNDSKSLTKESLSKVRAATDMPEDVMELYASIGARAFIDPMAQLGTFDGMRYHEEELRFGEFVLQYCEGKLSKAELFKRTAPVMKDRLVMHMLESHKVKLVPKCIWHEDGKNAFGKGYADFVAEVSASVTKGRRNKPQL